MVSIGCLAFGGVALWHAPQEAVWEAFGDAEEEARRAEILPDGRSPMRDSGCALRLTRQVAARFGSTRNDLSR